MEKILIRVLDDTLGKYLHGLNKQNLEIGVWKGEVNLRNIELRQDALAELQLPIHVHRGHVSTISLSIPWNKLSSQPVIVNIKDVYLLALPTDTSSWTFKDFDQFAYATKKRQILEYDTLKSKQLEASLESVEEKKKSEEKNGWIEKLVTKIISNLQLTIENVHFRYEHIPSKLGGVPPENIKTNPISFGITLKSIRAYSTNQDWQPTFNETLGLSHKIVNIQGVSFYGSIDSPSFTLLSGKEFELAMKTITVSKSDDYLFRPSNACLKAKIVLDPSTAPAFTEVLDELDFSLDTVSLTINEINFQNILRVINFMSRFGTLHKNFQETRKLNQAIENAKGNKHKIARERWLFAFRCTKKKFSKKSSSWDIAEVTNTLKERNVYVETFIQLTEAKKKK